jgi:hypothetical protein
MPQPRVTLELDEHDGPYWPGEALSGRYRIEVPNDHEVRAVELSVLWYTVGQGEEDLAVHYFERQSVDGHADADADRIHSNTTRNFRTVLPKSPLSYDGVIVKVRWCVRVRVFLGRGKQVVAERPLQLGTIPPAQIVTS